jgi:hypothetical protein
MMNDIFKLEIAQGWILIYMDDIIIANKGHREDMIKKVIYVLRKLLAHDLFIKPEKCEFLVTHVGVLGFVVENNKVEMERQKVSGIADWPPPQTLKQLQSFLAFCNFYHRFINHYADLCEPLNRLRKKDYPWTWEQDQQEVFDALKLAFTKEPVLLIPDNVKSFKVEANASKYATGAVLIQEDMNGDRHPVAFTSHSFMPAERNYQVYDHEFLAIL